MKELKQKNFEGERALFMSDGLKIVDSVFANGESPLKESKNIELISSMFKWKYPLWYCNNVTLDDCTLLDTARAGIWYTNDIKISNTIIQAPKTFRRISNLSLENVIMTDAQETLWNCNSIKMKNVSAKGDYFAMNCSDMDISNFNLIGNYGFDGAKNIIIHSSKLLTKDAFWNCENITVYDSFISGEYFGWNSKNITLINCTVESLQGMCYIENLVMKNCKLIDTTLAFEFSSVKADILGKINSITNPYSGEITADSIDEIIMENDRVDVSKTKITCRNK